MFQISVQKAHQNGMVRTETDVAVELDFLHFVWPIRDNFPPTLGPGNEPTPATYEIYEGRESCQKR